MATPYSSGTITSAVQLACTHHKPNHMPVIKNKNLLAYLTQILHANRGYNGSGQNRKNMAESERGGRRARQHCESFIDKENISEYISEGAECLQKHT